MRTAVARIVEARGRRGIAIGNLFPQSQALQANYAHGEISHNLGGPLSAFGGPVDVWVGGGNISWELDFWGRYRRMIESSNANLDRSVEDYGNVLVMTLSDVATYYVQMRTYEERLRFAERNVVIQTRIRCGWPKSASTAAPPPNWTSPRPAPIWPKPNRSFRR